MFNAARTVATRPTMWLFMLLPPASCQNSIRNRKLRWRRCLSQRLQACHRALISLRQLKPAILLVKQSESTSTTLIEEAADSMLASRKNDGFDSADTYRPVTSPRRLCSNILPVMSYVGGVKPFALKTVSQFRPDPPAALNSSLWARD
jgi:hypothetical protein